MVRVLKSSDLEVFGSLGLCLQIFRSLGRARYAGACGPGGLALSGDLIRGGLLGGRLESSGPLGLVFGAPGVLQGVSTRPR